MGYVYFLRELFTNTIKIGKSNNATDRLGILQTSLPFDVKEEFIIKTSFHNDLEKLLHEIFNHKRVKGEWFALTNDDLQNLKNGKVYTLIDDNLSSKIKDTQLIKEKLHLYLDRQNSLKERNRPTRVNVSLEHDIHNKLKRLAMNHEMTKTGFGAFIINTVLTNDDLLSLVLEELKLTGSIFEEKKV